jgi:prophage regulatory protein
MRRSLHDTPASIAVVAHTAAPVFLRMAVVVRMTGLGRSTIYRMVAEQRFPSPVRLAKRAIAWRQSDLDRWSEARQTVTH